MMKSSSTFPTSQLLQLAVHTLQKYFFFLLLFLQTDWVQSISALHEGWQFEAADILSPSTGRKHNNELVVTHYFQHTSIKHLPLSPSSDCDTGPTSGKKKREKNQNSFSFTFNQFSLISSCSKRLGVLRRSSAEGTLSSRFKLTCDFTRLDSCTCLCAPNARRCTEAKTMRQKWHLTGKCAACAPGGAAAAAAECHLASDTYLCASWFPPI